MMIYRAFLWCISVLFFSAGLSATLFSALLSDHRSTDPLSLFIGILLTTIGVLIYVHKLRFPPSRSPDHDGDQAPVAQAGGRRAYPTPRPGATVDEHPSPVQSSEGARWGGS